MKCLLNALLYRGNLNVNLMVFSTLSGVSTDWMSNKILQTEIGKYTVSNYEWFLHALNKESVNFSRCMPSIKSQSISVTTCPQ